MNAYVPRHQHRLSTAIKALMVIGEIINALGERKPAAGENVEGA